MKCLIKNLHQYHDWIKEFFPGIHPYNLRLLNKPLLEYYIDFCSLNSIKEIRVLKNDPTTDLEKYFGDGFQWGVNISYSVSKEDEELEMTVLKNSRFCKDDDLLILDGLFFINYDKRKIEKNIFADLGDRIMKSQSKSKIIVLSKDSISSLSIDELKPIEFDKISIQDIDNITTYYDICIDVLENRSEHYFLPGYSEHSDEHLGRNLVYDYHTVLFSKPLMIGDNVQIREYSNIGPSSIIGNNVIIDSLSSIEKSIVYDNSYLGSDLEINQNIIYKDKLIDPINKTQMDIADEFFISELQSDIWGKFFRNVTHNLIAILMLVIYFLPFIFFKIFGKMLGIKIVKQEFLINKKMETRIFSIPKIKKSTTLNRIYLRLSLDKYSNLFNVLKGKISLFGNQLLPDNTTSKKIVNHLPQYAPGLFSYSEMLAVNPSSDEILIHEIYFLHNNKSMMRLKILLITLLYRFFSVRKFIGKFSE